MQPIVEVRMTDMRGVLQLVPRCGHAKLSIGVIAPKWVACARCAR